MTSLTTQTHHIDIDIADTLEQHVYIASPEKIAHWCRQALSEIDTAELAIRIVDNTEIQALNQQYRQKNTATNVLSFPSEFPEGVDCHHLGDIVICANVVNSEASAQQKAPDAHWAHMVVHATLHLLGYDHISDAQANDMENLETHILTSLGFDAPYTPSHQVR